MNNAAKRRKKFGPRVRVGKRRGGHRAHRTVKRVITYGVVRTPKGVERPNLVKEFEQRAQVYERG